MTLRVGGPALLRARAGEKGAYPRRMSDALADKNKGRPKERNANTRRDWAWMVAVLVVFTFALVIALELS